MLALNALALEIARAQSSVEAVTDIALAESISQFRLNVVNLMKQTNREADGFSFVDCETQMEQVEVSYHAVKEVLLHAGAELRAPIPGMIDILEQNSRINRIAEQMIKATRYQNELYIVAEVQMPNAIDAALKTSDNRQL